MEVKAERVCGIDVHQKELVVTILIGSLTVVKPKTETRRYGTRTCELKALAKWLCDNEIQITAMESTGQYWRPVYNILSSYGLKIILANPQRIKGIPGNKTDKKDSKWIGELARMGLIAPSYIPSQEIQDLRTLTRSRTSQIQKLTKCKNQIHNILQSSNIKLTGYLTDIFGISGRKLLQLFIDGVTITKATVERIISKRVKASAKDISEAMDGRMTKIQRELLKLELEELDHINDQIGKLNTLINEATAKYHVVLKQLQSITGVSIRVSEIVLSEIGSDVKAFKDDKHLSKWAGLCPGSYESAGIKHSSKITKGNKYLKSALYQAALAASHSKYRLFVCFYDRIVKRSSKKKAIVAVAHKILRIIYALLSKGTYFDEEFRENKKSLSLHQLA